MDIESELKQCRDSLNSSKYWQKYGSKQYQIDFLREAVERLIDVVQEMVKNEQQTETSTK